MLVRRLLERGSCGGHRLVEGGDEGGAVIHRLAFLLRTSRRRDVELGCVTIMATQFGMFATMSAR
jgi:hypothetical protein